MYLFSLVVKNCEKKYAGMQCWSLYSTWSDSTADKTDIFWSFFQYSVRRENKAGLILKSGLLRFSLKAIVGTDTVHLIKDRAAASTSTYMIDFANGNY